MLGNTEITKLASSAAHRARDRLEVEYAVAKAHLAHVRGNGDGQRQVFGHVSDPVWLYLNTAGYRRRPILRQFLPKMPEDPELQKRYIGSSGDTAMREAWNVYRLWCDISARHGRAIGPESRVLDFGCGWGRTLRFFLRDVPPEQLHGADVLTEAVNLCRATNPWCQFHLVPALPPSTLPESHFDLVYLFSVFSHLSEDAHLTWLDEFHRVLRPGGLVIATTWHREYIEWCERARNGDTKGTHPRSVDAFVGVAEWLARYDQGEYCHSPVGGGQDLNASFYGETCIPEAYARRVWTKRFEIRDYLYADHQAVGQNVIVGCKR